MLMIKLVQDLPDEKLNSLDFSTTELLLYFRELFAIGILAPHPRPSSSHSTSTDHLHTAADARGSRAEAREPVTRLWPR